MSRFSKSAVLSKSFMGLYFICCYKYATGSDNLELSSTATLAPINKHASIIYHTLTFKYGVAQVQHYKLGPSNLKRNSSR